MSLQAAALKWAGRGWKVFPCNADKSPAISGGFLNASDDPDQITKWSWNGRLIGGVPGSAGLVVLDVDAKAGTSLSDLPVDLIQTRQHRTPSGGWHLIFEARENAYYGNGVRSDIAGGVDIRHHDGYVILPPSTGYTLGRDREIDPAPAVLEIDRQPERAKADITGEPWPVGTHSRRLFDLASQLVEAGVRDLATIEIALRAAIVTHCPTPPGREPFSDAAIRKIAEQGYRYSDQLVSKINAARNRHDPPRAEAGLTAKSLIGVNRKVATIYPGTLNIPDGTISILTGQQGTGKGLLEVHEIAAVSQDHGVLVASDEDSIEHTILPRLVAAGARIENVRMVQSLKLPHDTDGLIRLALEHGVRLVVVDPWTNHVGDIDVNKGPELREALMALKRACEEAGFVALLTAHPNKNSDRPDPLERVAHSQALTQVARSAFWIVLDPEYRKVEDIFGERSYPPRIVAQVKANLTAFADSRKYLLRTEDLRDPDQTVARLEYLCDSDHDWLALHKLARERDQAKSRDAKAPAQSDVWTRLSAYLDSRGGSAQRSEVMAALGIERGTGDERTFDRCVAHARDIGDLAPLAGRGVIALSTAL